MCAYSKGQKNDSARPRRSVQRPTMKFVATKTADQLDLQGAAPGARTAGRQRTGIINQIAGARHPASAMARPAPPIAQKMTTSHGGICHMKRSRNATAP